MPNQGQIALLVVSIVFFTIGGGMSFARMWRQSNSIRLVGKSSLYWGVAAAAGVLIWHSFTRNNWCPSVIILMR